MSFSNVVFDKSTNTLTCLEYRNILYCSDPEKWMATPPVKPNPGDIILYKNANKPFDWKSDQYRWKDNGRNKRPMPSPYLQVYYYKSEVVGTDFTRKAYSLLSDGQTPLTTVIHYFGKNDDIIDTPHGNRKTNVLIPHVMTAKSEIQLQKCDLKNKPKNVYRKHVQCNIHPALLPVMGPRDAKQCENSIGNERKKRTLSDDDVLGLYLTHHEIPDYIHVMQLIPEFVVVFFTMQMMALFEEIIEMPELVIHYDTTFNIGDFYLSILVYKHPVFVNEPVIPLACMLHHSKKTEVHKLFFETIKNKCNAFVKDGLKFVTDREAAISKALKISLPNACLYYCWNHILRDVEYWVKKRKNAEDCDEDIYKNHVWDLLDSDTEEQFFFKYEQISETWSKEFTNYFNSYLKDDLLTSGKWILNSREVNIYKERTGITNNPSESFNSVLKKVFVKEVKAQVCLLSIYELFLYYNKEIVRGFSKLGDYKMKSSYVHNFYIKPIDAEYPKSFINLKDIPYCFMNKRIQKKLEDGVEEEYSTFSLAKRLILQRRIVHVPELQCFIIKGENDEYKVKLNGSNKHTCTCKLKRNCHHIEAVRYSINQMDINQNKVKLHTLERKRRGFTSGRKKVPKNVTILEAADDSELFSQLKSDFTKSYMIPTATSTSNSVKRRFVQRVSHGNYEEVDSLKMPNTNERIDITPKKIARNTLHSTPEHNKLNLFFDRSSEISPIRNEREMSLGLSLIQNKSWKSFKVCGIQIYDSHLKPLSLERKNVDNDTDLYLYGSTICAYLSILCYERITKDVSMYTCDDIIVSHCDEKVSGVLKVGLREFLCRKIPEYDVVLFPVCKNSHCYLIVVLTKKYIVLNLDSLGMVRRSDLNFVMKLFKLYAKFRNQEFDENLYSFYSPPVYQQTNGYDCGAYACMFGEVIIRGDSSDYDTPINGDLFEYRNSIKNKIMKYKHEKSIILKEYDFDESKFKTFSFRCTINIKEAVLKEVPFRGDAMAYLKQIASSYWQSVCCDVCENEKNASVSQDASKKWIYCENGNHWLHWNCVGINNTDELDNDSYTCPRCEYDKSSEQQFSEHETNSFQL